MFRGLQTYIIVTQVIAMICYIVWPSRQDLCPEIFAHDNLFTWVIGFLYTFDTPTGICPSMHVGYSLGIASAWLKSRAAYRGEKIFVVVFVVFVILSIFFIKQHSVIDAFAALPMCLVADVIAFRPYRKKKKLERARF